MSNVASRPRSVKPTRVSAPHPSGPRAEPLARTSIHGYVYAIRALTIHPSIGTVAFAVDKLATRNTYVVHRDTHGEVCCDCPDYTMRKSGTGQACKHGAKLVALGLIEPPTPAAASPQSRVAAAPTPVAHRVDTPAVVSLPIRRTRFVPTPEDDALAAQMFA